MPCLSRSHPKAACAALGSWCVHLCELPLSKQRQHCCCSHVTLCCDADGARLLQAAKVQPLTLTGPRFSVRPGELVGICGEVGSGKSSLLAALLGELQPIPPAGWQLGTAIPGCPVMVGTVAYCQQTPWIVAGTVRENVTFGAHSHDEARCVHFSIHAASV